MRVFPFAACGALSALLALSLWAADPVDPTSPKVSIDPRAKPGEKEAPAPKANIRIDTTVVQIPVTVTDQLNRFVTGLEKENFRIFEDKVEQTVAYFSSEDAPLSVGIVFDTSAAWDRNWKSRARRFRSFSRARILRMNFFWWSSMTGRNWSTLLRQVWKRIQNKLTFTQSKGRTALLDAVYLALHTMKKARNPRKALLIISDGGDNSSRYTESEIKNLVREADVQIYAIGIFEPMSSRGRSAEELSGPGLLSEIAEQTGGRHFPVENLNDLPDVAAKIGIELRNQYLLGYTPTNARSGWKISTRASEAGAASWAAAASCKLETRVLCTYAVARPCLSRFRLHSTPRHAGLPNKTTPPSQRARGS